MNKSILHTDVQHFINSNLTLNITNFVLKGSPFNNIPIQELANQLIAKLKSQQKLPTWFATKNIYYPPKISIEQTSSEITANYKANLINGEHIIDITGGFGVDCYAFSKRFKKVTHCEINTELSNIVTHNYQQLNAKNITTVAKDGLEYLTQTNKKFDCIYIDPSRRNEAKGKVFLLKDCLPNVPENLSFLFTKSNLILVKNSPMLDVSATIKELNFVKEIHIVAVENEVKELLFLLEKNYKSTIKIHTVNILKNETQVFNFTYNSLANSIYSQPLSYLYEPNAAILKSGGFHHITTQLYLKKLHLHSHLYTSDKKIEFPGRSFSIKNVIPYNKKQLLKLLPERKANITTRNFPKTVAQLRKETKIKDGGNMYLFFTKNQQNKHIVIFCEAT